MQLLEFDESSNAEEGSESSQEDKVELKTSDKKTDWSVPSGN